MLDSLDERTIDWATAEELAFASILDDGIAIRLTGEDVERGTFSHRHAVFHDVKTGERYVPLQALPQAKAAFEIRNSPLSENATVGFEFGYNVQEPGRLVLWEAQYGDFINGAQVIIDEFITSGRAKWGLTPSLVLLLPHGYEGQGPDHSSARPERFLDAAADINLRLANCTTAAQYFHLLRRQALLLETDPLPLIVLTPKSLLAPSARELVARASCRKAAGSRSSTMPRRGRGRARSGASCCAAARSTSISCRARSGATSPGVAIVPRRAAVSVPDRGDSRRRSPRYPNCAKWSGCRRSPRTWARGDFVQTISRSAAR